MEAMLARKPRSQAIGVLRTLVVPLREHWGNLPAFVAAGLEVLKREGGGQFFDEKESPAHLEQLYRQVLRTRASYFRPVENVAQLEHLYKELDLAAAKAASPMQQGVLWLASRLQQQAITYLQRPGTEEQFGKVLAGVAQERDTLVRPFSDPERITLERVEAVLAQFAQHVLGGTLEPFQADVLAGKLLELVREAARKPPQEASVEDLPENEPTTPLLVTLTEPVRQGELNEARQRYSRLSEDEKNRRYNAFRRGLLGIIAEVAPFAPEGFETFCAAIEARMYPYPERLEFIRSFARNIYNNGSQITAFDQAQTPQSVEQRYEQMVKARQGNPLVLEVAKALALHNFRNSAREANAAYLREVDLKQEFGWPATMAELEAAMRR
ncbi:MAG: hypothetical protein GWO16_13785 [Gammaproteobacteria bacterium]|nr:hypothetical protein [Gammaproteobacteria bacterium]